jgi:thiamine-phosphate pyrophosphorylase
MPPTDRILDANGNRAREALRVMEEAARFILDDAELAGACKGLRHELAAALSAVLPSIGSRATDRDVGREISTEQERRRETGSDVVVAAGRRLGEALRALEEYGKTVDGDLAARLEPMRYRGYEIEQRIVERLPSGRPATWRLCVLLTATLCGDRPWTWVAERAIEGGADCLQLREKDLGDRELLDRAGSLVEIASGRASIIVNDRPDVALASGADGVHLGQDDMPCRVVRRLFGRRLLVGVSTSRLEQARQAQRDGADYCGVGPMFATTTKHKPVLAGPTYLREYLSWDGLPHLAIGGVTPENAAELAAAGARGIAASRSICAADDPAEVVRRLRGALTADR